MISRNTKETNKIAKMFLDKILTPVVEHPSSRNKFHYGTRSSLRGKNKKRRAIVVCLSGDLGAGKTAFAQAAARHLGIKSKITSPTFVIMKSYKLKVKNYKLFFHFDAYRLKNENELLYLKWEEIIGNEENLVFIEWPENVKKAIPSRAHFVYISHHKNNQRILELKYAK